jgi:hypothetical protein
VNKTVIPTDTLGTISRAKWTQVQLRCINPAWARDGRVFFVSARSGTENIWSLTTELGSYGAGHPDPARTTTTEQDATSAMSGN